MRGVLVTKTQNQPSKKKNCIGCLGLPEVHGNIFTVIIKNTITSMTITIQHAKPLLNPYYSANTILSTCCRQRWKRQVSYMYKKKCYSHSHNPAFPSVYLCFLFPLSPVCLCLCVMGMALLTWLS